jgi:signal transduction histidine kinase
MRFRPDLRAIFDSGSASREKAAAGLRCLILLTAFLMARLDQGPRTASFDLVVGLGAAYVLATTFLPMSRYNRRRATLAMLAVDILLISALIYTQLGIRSEYYLLYYLPIVHASVRLNFRDALDTCVLSAGSYLLVSALEGAGTPVTTTVISRALTFSLSAGLLAAFFFLLARQQRAFDQMSQEHQEAVRTKNEFLSRVSHEFRTPLTAIVGFSQLLSEHQEGLDSDRRQEYLSVIRDQSQHLARMIEDMLDIYRIGDGRLSLHPEVMNLQEAADAALTIIQDRGETHRIAVSTDPHTRHVWVDRRELEQVFDRLFHTALSLSEHSPPVSVGIGPASDEHMIQASIRTPVSEVTDGQLSAILGSSQAPLREAVNGRELGLAVSKALIELHGGRIWLEEDHPAGVAICFTVPAFQSQEAGPKVIVVPASGTEARAAQQAEADGDGEGDDRGRRSVGAEAHAR